MSANDVKTCDKCKHWIKGAGSIQEYGLCKNPKLDDGKLPDGAMPEAADDFGIHFESGPKFGCIHFELKQ